MHTCSPLLSSRPGPFDPVTHPLHTSVCPHFCTLTSCRTHVALPRSLCSFPPPVHHAMLAACIKIGCSVIFVCLFLLLFHFVFSQCHIGSSGENHSWQLFYSFLNVFCLFLFSNVQLRYLYFCNIKYVVIFSFIIVVMPVDNKCRDFYVYWKKNTITV